MDGYRSLPSSLTKIPRAAQQKCIQTCLPQQRPHRVTNALHTTTQKQTIFQMSLMAFALNELGQAVLESTLTSLLVLCYFSSIPLVQRAITYDWNKTRPPPPKQLV